MGKGHDTNNYKRYISHLYCKDRHTHFYNWLNKLKSLGYTNKTIKPFIIKAVNNLTENQAYKIEIDFISTIGRADLGTGTLTNLNNGGEGGISPSQEIKDKISAKNRGKFVGTKNGNYKNKDNYYGEGNPFYKKKHNEESISKMNRVYIGFDLNNHKHFIIKNTKQFIDEYGITDMLCVCNHNTQTLGWKFCKADKDFECNYNDSVTLFEEIKEKDIPKDLQNLLSYEKPNKDRNGINFIDNKYVVQFQHNKKKYYVGVYYTLDMAKFSLNQYILTNDINKDILDLDKSIEEIIQLEHDAELLYLKQFNKHYPNIHFQCNKWIGRKVIKGKRYNTKYYNTEIEAYNALLELIKVC